MLDFHTLLPVWGADDFNARFKAVVEQLSHAQLPLQQALAHTSYVSDEPFTTVVLNTEANADTLYVQAAVFYSGIIAGCSCADDPTPIEGQAESCQLRFEIDRRNGETRVVLLP